MRQRKSTKYSVSCSAAPWEETESKVKIRNYNVWYKILRPKIKNQGSDNMLPVLVLHGGPGIPSDYLETLGLLTQKYGRKVYFYDQIGCGNSDEPKDPSFYSVEQCAEDVAAMVKHLADWEGLLDAGGFHLYGQSWGGCLAVEALLLAHKAGGAGAGGALLAHAVYAAVLMGAEAGW
eukprot:CAMPEP_0172158510 /NCGR_PEP_ID=MMETSP1050-20130122/4414_1 /TAXON_ID=233186 /ORGANISM="Cryptomonas curvata, Strain CCAP979/52" /LENGTH=176 /DNA_ID=CAMNT_0012827913 /DNA_START=112 /DNA_END=639 /DNA_ORIENTATION=-